MKVVLRDDPEFNGGAGKMEFRLTYEGPLVGASKGNARTKHKHELRKIFHKQLKCLWETEPYLSKALYSRRDANPTPRELRQSLVEHLRDQYQRLGYEFVPLVTDMNRLYCAVEVLFLRPQQPGRALQSGDLDNRLKTLFDALRMPDNKRELGGYDKPDEGEQPFFVLMTDDKLITRVAVETDWLLDPTSPERANNDNDSRLFITIRLSPFDPGWDNISFV